MHPGISSTALLQGVLLPDKAGPLFAEVLCPTRVTPAGSSMPQQVRAHEHPANMFTLGISGARGGYHIPCLRGLGLFPASPFSPGPSPRQVSGVSEHSATSGWAAWAGASFQSSRGRHL